MYVLTEFVISVSSFCFLISMFSRQLITMSLRHFKVHENQTLIKRGPYISKDSLYLTKEELTSIIVVGQFPQKESKMRMQVIDGEKAPRGLLLRNEKSRQGQGKKWEKLWLKWRSHLSLTPQESPDVSTKEAGFTFLHQLVFVDVGLCWGRGFCRSISGEQLGDGDPAHGEGLVCQAPIMKYHKLGGLTYRNILSYISGSWKSKIKVLARFIPSKDCGGLSQAFILGLYMVHFLFTQHSLCMHTYIQISHF